MTELKPCPFCGGKASIREYSLGHKGSGGFTASYEVKCANCGISYRNDSYFTLVHGQPKFDSNGYEKCVEQWNRRANDE